MEVTPNQIKEVIEATKNLWDKFLRVHDFALYKCNIGFPYELNHICQLRDILYEMEEHYDSLFAKKNPKPRDNKSMLAEWKYNQAKYVNDKYTCFWNKFVENDPIYKKYRLKMLTKENIDYIKDKLNNFFNKKS